MRRHLLAVFAVLALVIGVGGEAAACTHQPVTYPTPAAWTVTYQHAEYCGYLYSPYEVDMYGVPLTCRRVMYPNPVDHIVAGTLAAALLVYLETYDGFYHSGYWYDQYYAPIGPRYHVTVVNRTTFTTNAHTFETRYAGDIKTRSAKASWRGAKTGRYQFPTSNAGAKKTRPLTNGDTHTKPATDGANHDEHTTHTTPRTGSTGKSGTKPRTPTGRRR